MHEHESCTNRFAANSKHQTLLEDGASSIAEQPMYLPFLNALLLFVTYCPLSGDLLCCRCLFCLLCDGGRRLSKVEDKSVIESLSCPVIFEGGRRHSLFSSDNTVPTR